VSTGNRLTAGIGFIAMMLAVLQGCATPAQRADRFAAEQGYRRVLLQGSGFTHVAYLKGTPGLSRPLHVYLEGDGSPWRGGRAAKYPTSRDPLMLKLMALDSSDSVYLGRPCYHGLNTSENCEPKWWTSHRYSEPVRDSMAAALLNLYSEEQPLVLLGHSGGGALAMLMAERLPNVRAVVTLAANLDIHAWTRRHDYPLLHGSLNPADRPPLPGNIHQLHLAGGRDDNVPAEFIQRVAAQQLNAEYRLLERYDHTCCWHEIWPEVLIELENIYP
jgi:pimeloyl-ACP methyl ester carboxylesterase